MHIVITGGAGFVGSNLALLMKEKYPEYAITSFDNLSRRGSELNVPRLQSVGVEFIKGDVRSKDDVSAIASFDCLIDAAAEPSVLAGITSPIDEVVSNNFLGTLNCLEAAHKFKASFIFLSTSRVYPIKRLEELGFEETETRFVLTERQHVSGASAQGIGEEFPLQGSRSFYGATKLASELFIEEYNRLLGLKTVINRCGVIAGPWQMGKIDQGVVALWVARHYWSQSLSYIGFGGEGKQVRDILHVSDLFDLIDFEIHHIEKVNGEIFNAGGGSKSSVSLSELTTLCEEVTGNRIDISKKQETREADIRIYITNNSKVTSRTGWQPKLGIKEIVQDVFKWIKNNKKSLEGILN